MSDTGEGPMVVPSLRVEFTDDEVAKALDRLTVVLRSGRLTLGPVLEELEAALAGSTPSAHAVGVASGTAAVEVVLRALDVRGRTVLLPANTNYATAAAVIAAGARPELYDSGLYPDHEDLGRRLRDEVAAVVHVPIGGYLDPVLPALIEVCTDAGIAVVCDGAQAHGAELDGVPASALGCAGTLSFYPTKVVTGGEGGAVLTDDDNLAAAARQLRDQGKEANGIRHTALGYNWRLSELAACVVLVQLDTFERDRQRRVELMAGYAAALRGVSFDVIEPEAGCLPGGYRCFALAANGEERGRIQQDAAARGVHLPSPVYEVPLHRQPVFAGVLTGHYPLADDWAARHLCLPVRRNLRPEEHRRVIEVLAEIGGRS